jgi:hypothetical protein
VQDPPKFKIYPNCNFWFENIPSGNPGMNDMMKRIDRLDTFSFTEKLINEAFKNIFCRLGYV